MKVYPNKKRPKENNTEKSILTSLPTLCIWGILTVLKMLEFYQSEDALKGQKALKYAPLCPLLKKEHRRGGKVKQQYKKH